jgi:hypothetical protein
MTARRPILNLNGYTDLPMGKIAAVVTYLEMTARPRLKTRPRDPAWTLERINGDLPRYRALFRRVGEPWLWFSRAVMPEATLEAILAHRDVEAYALRRAPTISGSWSWTFAGRTNASCSTSASCRRRWARARAAISWTRRSGGHSAGAARGSRLHASFSTPARSTTPPPCPSMSGQASGR